MTTPDGMLVRLGVLGVVNYAQVIVHPTETVGTAATLWESQSVLTIEPGSERVVWALFRDEAGERCGAVEVVEPVANTDYKVWDNPNGTGFDYTEDPAFSIAFVTEATRMKITLGNVAIGPLYVTALKVRGKPLRTYDPVVVEKEDAPSQAAYEMRARTYDLTMQDDPNFARDLADYMVDRYASPVLEGDLLRFRDHDVVGEVNLYGIELMDKITISDPQTGINGADHWVRGVEYDLGPVHYEVTFHLERADDLTYWVLADATLGKLGTTTRLAV